jgi:hypothetical protein
MTDRPARIKYSKDELNNIRYQLHKLDTLEGFKMVQLRKNTDEAIEGLSRSIPGEKRTYDSIILMCIQAYKKQNPNLVIGIGLPEPTPLFEKEEDEGNAEEI